MRKPLVAAALGCAAFLALVGPQGIRPASAREPNPAQIKVLTWNLYLGADVVPTIAALSETPELAPMVVAETFRNVRTTDFPTRAKKLAELIAAEKPDVVALQECVLWRSQPASDFLTGTLVPNATHVEFDFAKILLKELKKRKLKYLKKAVTIGSDVEAPWLQDDGATIGDLRLTDRDVILVRKGVKVQNVVTSNFEVALVLPILDGVTVLRTFTAFDAKVRGKSVRVVATHLESDAQPIRAMQALELGAGPLATTMPVVVLGDFNTDATLPVPEDTYANLLGAGLVEVWPALYAGDPGLTWGQQPLLDNVASTHFQRIDMVFTKGAVHAVAAELLGEVPEDRTPTGLWPSDHAGVVATLEIE